MQVSDDDILTTTEAAALVGVSPGAIRNWVHRGVLRWDPDRTPATRKGVPRGQGGYRFRAGDVRAAAASRNTAARALRAQRRT